MEFDLKVRCFELGRRLWEAEFQSPQPGQVSTNPMFTYSKELNTCVLYAGYLGPTHTSEFLIDVLGNRELASSIRMADAGTFGLSKDDFAARKRAFFPE